MMRPLALAAFLAAFLAAALLPPTAAAAQTVGQDVPRPGTYNDASLPLKAAADGPPRSLIRPQAAAVAKPVVVAGISARKLP